MKKGMVLEGGAMRGLFTAGVLDVLMTNGIEVDGVIGVSAGATFGFNYKSKQIGRTLRYNTNYAHDKRLCSVWSLLLTGDLYGAKFCYDTLPNKLDIADVKTYLSDPMEFWVVCTNAETGEPVYKLLENMDERDMAYMRASASMPVVSRAVQIDGLELLDGGISDSIPIKAFEDLGYGKNIVVLTQPKDFVKPPVKGAKLMDLLLKKYPAVMEDLRVRHTRYNETLAYLREKEKEGSVLIIQPHEKLPIGRIEHDTQVIRTVYDEGIRTGEEMLGKVREFLNG